MIFELREYDIKPGGMDEWVRLMQMEIHPFQMKFDVVFVASFVSLDDPNKYIWIRRFADESARQRIYKELYEHAYWVEQIKPHVDRLMNGGKKVTLMKANFVSPIH